MQWIFKNQSKHEKIKTLENTIVQLVNIINVRVAFINKNKELYDKIIEGSKVVLSLMVYNKCIYYNDLSN